MDTAKHGEEFFSGFYNVFWGVEKESEHCHLEIFWEKVISKTTRYFVNFVV